MNTKQIQILREKIQELRDEKKFNIEEIDNINGRKNQLQTRNDEINAEILEIKEVVE